MPTPRSRRRARYLGVALTPLLFLAACGEDDEGAEDDQTVPAFVNLRAEDFPEGYDAGPDPDEALEADPEAEGDPLLECLGVEADYREQIEEQGDSPAFELIEDTGASNTASSSTTLYADAGTAESVFGLLRSENLGDCMREQFEQSLGELAGEVTLEGPELQVDEGFSTVGDESLRLRGEMTLSDGEISFPGQIELVQVRTGAVLTSISAVSAPEAFPDELLTTLAGKVAERQAEAAS